MLKGGVGQVSWGVRHRVVLITVMSFLLLKIVLAVVVVALSMLLASCVRLFATIPQAWASGDVSVCWPIVRCSSGSVLILGAMARPLNLCICLSGIG